MTKARENSDYTGLQGDLALKAPVASPSFTGNVGIGTATPATKVTAYQGAAQSPATSGSMNTGFMFGQGSTDPMLNFGTDGDGAWYNSAYANNAGVGRIHRWLTGGTERMRIDGSGNVFIGKTGAVATQDGFQFKPTGECIVGRGSNDTMFIFQDSNSGGAQVGSISMTSSSTAYNTSSDYRLKENVTPMVGATAAVKLLKPCNFDWISSGDNVNGFLAHELAEVVPEAATGTKDAMMDEEYEVTPAVLDDEGNETTAAVMGTRLVPDMQGIDQSKLVPLLTATIQELIARIETLEAGE